MFQEDIAEVIEIAQKIAIEEIASADNSLKATIKELEEKLRLEIEGSKSEMHSMQEELKELKKRLGKVEEPEKPKVKDFSKK